MDKQSLVRYAQLISNYCLSVKKGDRVFILSTFLASELIEHIQDAVWQLGGHIDVELRIPNQDKRFLLHAKDEQLDHIHPLYAKAMEEYEAFAYIMAPFDTKEIKGAAKDKVNRHLRAKAPFSKAYSQRTANGQMNRTLCLFPTLSAAKDADMSLEELENYVIKVCKLDKEDPMKEWQDLGKKQQAIVDLLNQKTQIQYVNADTNISFSTKGRTWINSDGRTNMPSGEVYTSPVEESVEGFIRFDVPSVYKGHDVEDVQLVVKGGLIQEWDAKVGKEVLDGVFELEGARHFGEAAIGTNYEVDRVIRNILYDEKMGGTVHMAIGQSYLQAGGKNQSPVHWDLLSSMQKGGKIFADGDLIYQDGRFLI